MKKIVLIKIKKHLKNLLENHIDINYISEYY